MHQVRNCIVVWLSAHFADNVIAHHCRYVLIISVARNKLFGMCLIYMKSVVPPHEVRLHNVYELYELAEMHFSIVREVLVAR